MAQRQAFAWMGLAQGASLVLQFSASVVLARLLTPQEMGVYAVAAATASVLAVMHAFGLQAFIVREIDLTAEKVATAFTFNAIICLTLAAGTFALSFVGGDFLRDKGVTEVLLALTLNPIFGIFDFLPYSLLQREKRFREISLFTTATGLVTTVCTVGLALAGWKYMSMAYGQWVGLAFNAVLVNVAARSKASFRISFKGWRPIGNFGLQMLAVSGITSASQKLSDVVLGRLLGLSALGLYARAGGLNNLIWMNLTAIASKVIFSDIADHTRRGISLRDSYMRTVQIITALLWPAFAGLAMLSAPFIFHVYGERWLPAAPAFVFLAIGSMVQTSITMTWELFAASGNLRTQTRIEFYRTILGLCAFVGGCFIGLTAAAATRVIDAMFAVWLYRPYVDRMTDTSLRDFVPIYRQGILLTLLAIAPAGAMMGLHRFAADVPLWQCGASIVVGVALWVVALFSLGHPLAGEMTALTNHALARLPGKRRAHVAAEAGFPLSTVPGDEG